MKHAILFTALILFSCAKDEGINPEYFRLQTDVRDRQTRDPITKQTYWIRDTCRVVWIDTRGDHYLNDVEIKQQICMSPTYHYNLCHAKRGDVVGIKINGEDYEQTKTFE